MLDWATDNRDKSAAARLILHKEYKTWSASYVQEPGASWQSNTLQPTRDHDEARRTFKASAMWFYLRDKKDVKDEPTVDHSECHWFSIKDLIYSESKLKSPFDVSNGESNKGFVWFHIPENNLQWVVDLH